MNNLSTIKNIVEEILMEDEESRNNDAWLIIKVLRSLGHEINISYDQLKEMPSFETITRCRRLIQNTERKFPPRVDVDRLRNQKEEEFKSIWKNSHLT